MSELFNFNNTSILLVHNWIWLALAFLIGAWVGYTTSLPSKSSR